LLENDLIIERFFQKHQGSLSQSDHDGLAQLLDLTDNDLMDLLLARVEPPGELDNAPVRSVLAKLQQV